METAFKTPDLIKRLRDHLKACSDLKSMDWHKNYGRSLSHLRDKKGLTLRDMGEATGISVASLCRLENGEAKWTEILAEKYLKSLE